MIHTIPGWYGRFGNNIQQICNCILYATLQNESFSTPDHEWVYPIRSTQCFGSMTSNRFFFYNTQHKDFNIDVDYLYANIGKIAKQYVVPALKFSVHEPFDEDTLVIHIRSGDIFAHEHNPPHDYAPNPLCYYLSLIVRYNRVIVVTEPDNYNPIVDVLRSCENVTIQSTSVAEDFATLLRAKNLATSGTGTFAVAAALCSSNLKKFHCSNLYLTEHLNPEMVVAAGVDVEMVRFDNYIQQKQWINNQQQRKFILEYQNESV